MSDPRLQEIITELCRLLDVQGLVLERRVSLSDMSTEEIESYAQRNYRIRQLCNELYGGWSDGSANATPHIGIHAVGPSRLVN